MNNNQYLDAMVASLEGLDDLMEFEGKMKRQTGSNFDIKEFEEIEKEFQNMKLKLKALKE